MYLDKVILWIFFTPWKTPNKRVPYLFQSIVLRVDIGTRVVQTLGQFTTYKRLIDVSINKGSGDLYPISLALVPITYATNWILWERSVARWIDEGICTTDFSLQSNIARVTSNIETTVQQYENWTPVPISVPSPTTVSSLKTSTSKSVPYTISTKIYTSLTHLTTGKLSLSSWKWS